MSALPSQRSTQHPPSIASPAPPYSGERNASRLRIPTQEDIRENARKNAVSCKNGSARDCQSARQQLTAYDAHPELARENMRLDRTRPREQRTASARYMPLFQNAKGPRRSKATFEVKKTLQGREQNRKSRTQSNLPPRKHRRKSSRQYVTAEPSARDISRAKAAPPFQAGTEKSDSGVAPPPKRHSSTCTVTPPSSLKAKGAQPQDAVQGQTFQLCGKTKHGSQ